MYSLAIFFSFALSTRLLKLLGRFALGIIQMSWRVLYVFCEYGFCLYFFFSLAVSVIYSTRRKVSFPIKIYWFEQFSEPYVTCFHFFVRARAPHSSLGLGNLVWWRSVFLCSHVFMENFSHRKELEMKRAHRQGNAIQDSSILIAILSASTLVCSIPFSESMPLTLPQFWYNCCLFANV